MPTLEELKLYLRIDGDAEDMTLNLLLSSAQEYLANAGIPVPDTASSLYTLAVYLYCAQHYENRDPSMDQEKFGYGLQSIILQLKKGW